MISHATTYQQRAGAESLRLLRDALTLARIAKSPKLIARIESAVESARGAVRYMETRRQAPRKNYGVLHLTKTEREDPALVCVESPERPQWWRVGQYA